MSEVAVKGKDCGGTVDGGAGWGSCKDKTQRICVCVCGAEQRREGVREHE